MRRLEAANSRDLTGTREEAVCSNTSTGEGGRGTCVLV